MTDKYTLSELTEIANYEEENEWDCVYKFKPQAQHAIKQLLNENTAMREALEFYADAEYKELIEDFGTAAISCLDGVTK